MLFFGDGFAVVSDCFCTKYQNLWVCSLYELSEPVGMAFLALFLQNWHKHRSRPTYGVRDLLIAFS